MLNYRQLELVSGDATKLAENKNAAGILYSLDDFMPVIQYNGYIIIEAKDTPQKGRLSTLPTLTYIVQVLPESLHVTSAQYFLKLMNRIPTIERENNAHNLDILLVTYDKLGTNILNKFGDFNTPGTATSGYIRILSYTYDMFSSERMKHKAVPPSRIITKEEEKKNWMDLYTSGKNIPKMHVNEVIAVWLGAEIGDVILQLIHSECSGIEAKIFLVRP